MQSNNPVFRRSAAFNGSGAGNAAYAAPGHSQQGGYADYSSDPSTWGTGQGGLETGPRMTLDSVVQKAAFSIGLVILSAMATWVLTPEISPTNPDALASIGAAATVGLGAAFVLSLVNSFKRVISPGLVLAFAVAQGVGIGAISKVFNVMYPGVVMGAVIGTFAAFAGTLAAYKVLNIKVNDKFRIIVVSAMFGMVGLGLMELVLGLFGAQIGLFGVSGLGMVTAVIGLVLGIFMLLMDFDYVERGIAAGLDERESWRAAFAMTVSLVWIYTNLLRILAYFTQE